jgi:hypothetical protein
MAQLLFTQQLARFTALPPVETAAPRFGAQVPPGILCCTVKSNFLVTPIDFKYDGTLSRMQ